MAETQAINHQKRLSDAMLLNKEKEDNHTPQKKRKLEMANVKTFRRTNKQDNM